MDNHTPTILKIEVSNDFENFLKIFDIKEGKEGQWIFGDDIDNRIKCLGYLDDIFTKRTRALFITDNLLLAGQSLMKMFINIFDKKGLWLQIHYKISREENPFIPMIDVMFIASTKWIPFWSENAINILEQNGYKDIP